MTVVTLVNVLHLIRHDNDRVSIVCLNDQGSRVLTLKHYLALESVVLRQVDYLYATLAHLTPLAFLLNRFPRITAFWAETIILPSQLLWPLRGPT